MNELKVSLENIIPLTYARDHFSQIVAEVQKDKLFVLTKGGKPAVAIIDARYLESITGGQIQRADIKEEIRKAPEKVGLPSMVEHNAPPAKPIVPPPPPSPSPKPAGFAAPQPPRPKEEMPKVEPKPIPPPPPIPKQEPKPTPPPLPPPVPKPAPTPPPPPPVSKETAEKPEGLVMPQESANPPAGIPNKPLTTLPPVGEKPEEGSQVSVEFAPDEETIADEPEDHNLSGKAPDDKKPPAQYAGEEEEPEDMPLD